jgi:hypothetical protein
MQVPPTMPESTITRMTMGLSSVVDEEGADASAAGSGGEVEDCTGGGGGGNGSGDGKYGGGSPHSVCTNTSRIDGLP